MQRANLNLNRILQIVAVACIVVVFTASVIAIYDSQRVLTVKDFPLEVNLDRTHFSVGENITLISSIINRSGRDVNVSSNGQQPFVYIRNINDNRTYVQTCPLVYTLLESNAKISRSHDYIFTEAGTYVLQGCYFFGIGNIEFENRIANITIEVR